MSFLRRFPAVLVAVALCLVFIAVPAGAQYGGVSGLFVITSPDEPGVADFNGLGCPSGSEVVLYLPGIPATADDPRAATNVPGRVVAVTTAVVSDDALRDGTFSFTDVDLPDDLAPGFYEFHARCGTVDLTVVIELTAGGGVTVTPDEEIESIRDQIVNPSGTLPFTGRESSRLLSFAAALFAAGGAFLLAARRRHPDGADAGS